MSSVIKQPSEASGDRAAGQASTIFNAADSATAREQAMIVERFAKAYVELGSWAAAYRRCYDCSNMKPGTVWRNAYSMSKYPGVLERVRDLFAEGAQHAIVTVAEMLRHCVEVATADPNEVVRVTDHACRHCWGVDGAYQWRNENEFATACAAELDRAGKTLDVPTLPSDAGGYGFTMHRPPNPECETCGGGGQKVVHISDTAELTGAARKLYKGAKMDRHGVVTVELHDQSKYADMANRILGAYKDATLLIAPGATKPETIPATATKDEVQAAYQRMLG